jgi:hypothetical protein
MINRPALRGFHGAEARGAPGWTIGGFVKMDIVRPHLMDEFADALRKAGLPD